MLRFGNTGSSRTTSFPVQLEVEECACPVCGCRENDELLRCDSFGFPINTVQCVGCGLVYSNPRPSTAFLTDFYRRKYRRFYEGIGKITDSYVGSRNHHELAARRMERYRKYLGQRILEVGSGTGCFLNAVRNEFPDTTVIGLEPDPYGAEYARKRFGAIVEQKFLADYVTEEAFDVVTSFHVIEHIADLSDFLNSVRSILSPDGFVIIETPNVAGSWSGIGMFHVAHLQTFSPSTISNLLQGNSFEVVECGALESAFDRSNMYVVARQSTTASEPLLNQKERLVIRHKCAALKVSRTARVVRSWARMVYFALGGIQPSPR